MCSHPTPNAQIVDIRDPATAITDESMRNEVIAGLTDSTKKWPVMILYDERGLQLYDAMTSYAPEYYLFAAETNILQRHADEIVQAMRNHAANAESEGQDLVELGSGALRKTTYILSALARQIPEVTSTPTNRFYALDLDEHELVRTLQELESSPVGREMKGKVSAFGLWGTYDDGTRFITAGGLEGRSGGTGDHAPIVPNASRPLHMLFLGSTLGNFARREDMAAFLKTLPLRPGSGDSLLLGMDQNDDGEMVYTAYNTRMGLTRAFAMNGLVYAGRILGDEDLFDVPKWEYVGRYVESLRRYEFYLESQCEQTMTDPVTGIQYTFPPGHRIFVNVAHKFSDADAHTLFEGANLRPIRRWTDDATKYAMWLLERPASTTLGSGG
ncbi:histidine-specific methyltransferase [Cubamyces lactineus]|nr:histidine-specific methyltransferase [Cubamyces lactineus]